MATDFGDRNPRRDDDGTAPEPAPDAADGAADTGGAAGTGGAPGAQGASGEAGAETSADGPRLAGQQAADFQDKWLRARAEIENVRRTLRQDVDNARRYGAAPVLTGLIEVLDNLQRAIASPPPDLDPTFLHGLQLIEQQFLGVLAAHGVSPVPAARGQPPDPNLHRTLMEQPSDEAPAGTILHVAAPGYRLHDRLLREAQVIVARAPDR
jgi:molecular chaperone GrpE